MTDGFRWLELFEGADSELMDEEHGHVADTAGLRKEFGREVSLRSGRGTLSEVDRRRARAHRGTDAQVTPPPGTILV